MGKGKQAGTRDWDATLTLWREAIPGGGTAEDSIRASHETYPAEGVPKPRIRTLNPGGDADPDFELGEQLGSGGMGVVYAANQTALNREVAVKMVKPGRNGSAASADALMAEAVVTGRLEHPNIVPVYDLGVDAQGNLFYAMKEVQGFPWSQLMAEKTLDENLDILLRVADTVSFAHSRGILHRDLKPQNIMLGEFGEVMVMDWGASCAIRHGQDVEGAGSESSLSGTPAYMPPEMARGDLNRQGGATDVYLLGGMLYQVITGHPPRREKDAVLCINLASENHIDPAGQKGELLRIALKAMSAVPADRFADVRGFQEAIRDYRSHSESLLLMENAKVNLARARQENDYDLFSRAIFGFRESLQLWPDNPDAEELRVSAVLDYARCAFGNTDFELALSLLDPDNPLHGELLDLIQKAIRDRDAHKRRSRRLLMGIRLLGVVLLLFFALAFFLIRSEHRKTIAEHRQSLVNLISAHYGEQNYEATVASFWELHDAYGMESLNEDILLDVRVAANMNPWQGAVESGINTPLGINRSAEEGHVWVVGREAMAKIRLESNTSYVPGSEVAIHDFRFGRRPPCGKVVETIGLPHPLKVATAVCEGADGTLWMGSGSLVFKRGGGAWESVVDMASLEIPPLPDAYDVEPEELAEQHAWMMATGRKLPITGLAVNRAQTHAAVVLGGGVLCWVDLVAKECRGWYPADLETYAKSSGKGGRSILRFSPEEDWLLFREGATGTFIFAFELPGLVRKGFYYGRSYPMHDIAFPSRERFWSLHDYRRLVFAPTLSSFSQYGGGYRDGNGRWEPTDHETRRLEYDDWKFARLSPSGRECLLLTKDNRLFHGSTMAGAGFDLSFKVADRNWVDAVANGDGRAYLLADDGAVHAYGTDAWAIQRLPLNGKVVDVCTGHRPDQFFVLVGNGDGRRDLVEISNIRSSSPQLRVVVADTDHANISCDPKGRYLVAYGALDGKVYDAQTGAEVAVLENKFGNEAPFKFDPAGEYFVRGGEWSHGLEIYRVSDWKRIYFQETHFYQDFQFRPAGASNRMVRVRDRTIAAAELTHEGIDFESNTLWQANTGGSALSLIPFVQPSSGRECYWCRTWFDYFYCFDAETGKRAAETFKYWLKQGLGTPAYTPGGDILAFPKADGGLEMTLRTDLYPVFDPRTIGCNVERAAFNSDSSMLALLSEGGLVLVNCSGALGGEPPGDVRTHHVSPSGLGIWPYDSWLTAANDLHRAVETAADGSVVLIDEGRYSLEEPLMVRKPIALRGHGNPEDTVLDGGGKNRLLNFSLIKGACSVEGLTFTGGSDRYAGGIHIFNCWEAMVSNCIVRGNSATGSGGGLIIGIHQTADNGDVGRIVVADCIVSNNTSSGGGSGGIEIWVPEEGGIDLLVKDCLVADNRAQGRGGGIGFHCTGSTGRVEIARCRVEGNQSADHGGGIHVHSTTAEVRIRDCTVKGNSATKEGGGIWSYAKGMECLVTNTVFEGNRAGESGHDAQGCTLTNCTFDAGN